MTVSASTGRRPGAIPLAAICRIGSGAEPSRIFCAGPGSVARSTVGVHGSMRVRGWGMRSAASERARGGANRLPVGAGDEWDGTRDCAAATMAPTSKTIVTTRSDDLPDRPRRDADDLARLPVHDEAVDLPVVAVGRDPDRQEHVLERRALDSRSATERLRCVSPPTSLAAPPLLHARHLLLRDRATRAGGRPRSSRRATPRGTRAGRGRGASCRTWRACRRAPWGARVPRRRGRRRSDRASSRSPAPSACAAPGASARPAGRSPSPRTPRSRSSTSRARRSNARSRRRRTSRRGRRRLPSRSPSQCASGRSAGAIATRATPRSACSPLPSSRGRGEGSPGGSAARPPLRRAPVTSRRTRMSSFALPRPR